jgi:TonB family protein
MNTTWFLAEVVVLGCTLVGTTGAQISLAGATHLDAREVVVSVYPNKLDGVHFLAKIRHKKKWAHFSTRLDPQLVSRWLESIDRMPPRGAEAQQWQSPVLAGLGGKEGIVLVVPAKGDRYWLLQQLEDQPLLIKADRQFNDTLLVALQVAMPFSGIDSVAFASGLVPPLVTEPESCLVRIISIPRPYYPFSLSSKGVEGRVEMRYIVNADGRVDTTSFEALWATHPEFITAAKDALKQGRFRPAVLDGKPIRRQVYQAISFRPDGTPAVWH